MTKIMLVEDDKSLREIYGVRLLAEGYDIVSAGDGEEALAMAIKDRPDLIVSDVMMPKISGFDMLDILRSTTETKGIRVIMMTALSSEEQRQRGEQLGADKYLVKSQVGIEDVVKAVHEVLGDKPGTSSAPLGPPSTLTTPPAPGSQSVSMTPTPATTIPEPTAPFTGNRPAGLGERVIHPLKDNPRVSNVNVGELMDKEIANTIQKIEDVPVAPPPEQPSASERAILASTAPAADPQAATATTTATPVNDMGMPSAVPADPDPAVSTSVAATPASIPVQSASDDSTTPAVEPVAQVESAEHVPPPITPPERPN